MCPKNTLKLLCDIKKLEVIMLSVTSWVIRENLCTCDLLPSWLAVRSAAGCWFLLFLRNTHAGRQTDTHTTQRSVACHYQQTTRHRREVRLLVSCYCSPNVPDYIYQTTRLKKVYLHLHTISVCVCVHVYLCVCVRYRENVLINEIFTITIWLLPAFCA